MRRTIFSLIILTSIASGTLFFHLGSLPLSGADEPRYARIAEEMGQSGNWVTPVLEGKPWLEKPPLYYWLTIPAYSLFKENEAAARMGPALCALLSGLAIFWLGTQLWSMQAGLYGAVILLTSLGYIGFGRGASTDMPFTCCLTLFLAVLLRSSWDGSPEPSRRKKPLLLSLFGYLFLGLAILGKGPVALVLAAGILLCVWFLDERGGLFRLQLLIPGLIVTALVSIPWFWLAFRQNGFAFISVFFINHNLARYTTSIHHHSQPFIYYLPVLLGLFFPWSSWLPLLISKSPLKELRRWREWDTRMVFLACWFLFPIAFFSLSDSKLAGYILPSLPPLALMVGVYISKAVDTSRLKAAAVVDLVFALGMSIAAPIAFQKEYGGAWKTGLLISSAILIPAVFSIIKTFRGQTIQAFRATAVQGVVLVLILAQFGFPVLGAYHSTKEIAQRAIELRKSGEPIVTYRFFHHTLHYYTGYQVSEKLDTQESLLAFARQHPSFLVVTDVHNLKEIEGVQLAVQGKLILLRAGAPASRRQ